MEDTSEQLQTFSVVCRTLWQKEDMEGTEEMKLTTVASNSSVHIFLLEVAMPRAGAAENEWGVNSYSDKLLSTHPE